IYTGDIRVQAVYRDQWNSVTNAYRTGSVNGEYKMPVGKSNDFLTTGLQILYDRAGTIGWTTTQILPVLNYHKSLSDEQNRYLSLGFMGGWVQQYFDRSKMTTNSTYDGLGDGESLQQANFSYIDGSVGMSYNSSLNDNPNNNFFIGAAYHHFNHPKNSFYRNANIQLPSKWVFSTGFKFEVTEYSYFNIQADYSMQSGSTEAVAGAMYGLKFGVDADHPNYAINGGAFLRWNDALIPVIKIDYSPFSVVLSYDVNISPLKTSSYGRGGFEMSVSYMGFLNRFKSTQNSTLCPRF
ncbi:MAG: PorP/SprF family type IX secretion system membrane protein, partial [Bacteroidetes bacterium]|nr:PorP/SprF family type IX secretion system membrane protein [Bacteroidota bacterium]